MSPLGILPKGPSEIRPRISTRNSIEIYFKIRSELFQKPFQSFLQGIAKKFLFQINQELLQEYIQEFLQGFDWVNLQLSNYEYLTKFLRGFVLKIL